MLERQRRGGRREIEGGSESEENKCVYSLWTELNEDEEQEEVSILGKVQTLETGQAAGSVLL